MKETYRDVLPVHFSLVSVEVLDFLHSLHLVLIYDTARGREEHVSC